MARAHLLDVLFGWSVIVIRKNLIMVIGSGP
jgi:hypothetical protein